MPYHENSSISGYLTDSFEGISRTFTDFEEVPTPGHNRLVKAKRFGRWWMLKGLKPEASTEAIYRQALCKELEVMLMMQHPGVVQTVGMERVETLGDSIRHLTANNRQLLADLNRLSDTKRDAMTALHREMKHTQIDRHLDTLTQWAWHWPDMSERILRVNRFIYGYCERLDDSFSSDEKRQIQEAMLDEWQKWNQRISQSAGKSYKQTSGKKSLQH